MNELCLVAAAVAPLGVLVGLWLAPSREVLEATYANGFASGLVEGKKLAGVRDE